MIAGNILETRNKCSANSLAAVAFQVLIFR
jgi:hypothetical protein